MAYCSLQDMIDRFGEIEMIQLSDKENTGLLNIVRIQAAIDDAFHEINYDLMKCYRTPIQSEVGILKHWNCDVARYHLYDSIRLSNNSGGSDHEAQRRYKDYEEEVKNICDVILMDNEGKIIPKIGKFGVVVAERESCTKWECCPSCGCEVSSATFMLGRCNCGSAL